MNNFCWLEIVRVASINGIVHLKYKCVNFYETLYLMQLLFIYIKSIDSYIHSNVLFIMNHLFIWYPEAPDVDIVSFRNENYR